MFLKIKNRIEAELKRYLRDMDKLYSLSRISPVMSGNIKEFMARGAKRLRPVLFVIGYLGYADRAAGGLYRAALSIELLHGFMLVHDDIIDKSSTRRGKPSMHAALDKYLAGRKNLKFNGTDLAIIIGDILYALALDSFLSIKEDARRKEAALKRLIAATVFTAGGEFSEVLYGAKDIREVTKEAIYRIYDLKTANYTFASPLAIGSTLAGAGKKETDKLFAYGIYLGRAFQIKDDILGLFGEEKETGKSGLSDLQEAKKTLLVWQAWRNCGKDKQKIIERIFSKEKVDMDDLLNMRGIITDSGALDYARRQIETLRQKAEPLLESLNMGEKYKRLLGEYLLKNIHAD